MAERVSALETFMHVVTYQDIVINAKSVPSNLGLKILHQKICQGLAGPWYAQRERGTVKAKVQWFNGSRI